MRSSTLFADEIFDLDIHKIPHWKNVYAHSHFDVRFLIHASHHQMIQNSEESHDLRWIDFSEIKKVAPDASVLRLVEKTI